MELFAKFSISDIDFVSGPKIAPLNTSFIAIGEIRQSSAIWLSTLSLRSRKITSLKIQSSKFSINLLLSLMARFVV